MHDDSPAENYKGFETRLRAIMASRRSRK